MSNREVYLPTSHAVGELQRVTAVVLTDGYISALNRSHYQVETDRISKYVLEIKYVLEFKDART